MPVLGLSERADGGGELVPLEGFMTNPVIVYTVGAILQVVEGEADAPCRYLVIARRGGDEPGQAPCKYRFPNLNASRLFPPATRPGPAALFPVPKRR
jgi:hypothetical protein